MSDSPHRPPQPARHPRLSKRAMTLVEVMVASVLFTILAMSLTAAMITNYRFARRASYRTQAITSTMGLVEQLRTKDFDRLKTIYNSPTTQAFKLQIIDPTNFVAGKDADGHDIPVGYRQFDLPINVKDGVTTNANWTNVNIPLDIDGKLRLQMRYWYEVKYNPSSSGSKCDVFESRLVYQFREPGNTVIPWQSGVFRIAVPLLNPSLEDVP